jgi:ABC-2 type transport system ATP-binding protein
MNAIETQNLSKHFGDRIAVDRLSIQIPRGIVFGFLGPNGAGKTTTVRMLSALIAPTTGNARVLGHALGSENHAIRSKVGLLTESPGMYDLLTAWDNLLFFAELHDLDKKKAQQQAERYLKTLMLWERRNEKVGGFSKGMRQRLAIARSLLHEPELVFLDEPTSGLDPEAARTVRSCIEALRQEGKTVFLTTHNLAEADELCDLVGFFGQKLFRLGTAAEIRAELFGSQVHIQLAENAEKFVPIVQALAGVQSVSLQGQKLLVTFQDGLQHTPMLVNALSSAGASIFAVQPVEHSLEEIYLTLLAKRGTEHT